MQIKLSSPPNETFNMVYPTPAKPTETTSTTSTTTETTTTTQTEPATKSSRANLSMPEISKEIKSFELKEFKRGGIIYFSLKNHYCKTFRRINCHIRLQISTKV